MRAPYETVDNEPMPKEPLAHAQSLVLQHADQLKNLLDNMEEQIAIVGHQLDQYTKARDVLSAALLGTEKLRVEITPTEPGEPEGYGLRISGRSTNAAT